jgi:hypothetical protein
MNHEKKCALEWITDYGCFADDEVEDFFDDLRYRRRRVNTFRFRLVAGAAVLRPLDQPSDSQKARRVN